MPLTVYSAHLDYAGADRLEVEPHSAPPGLLFAPGHALVPRLARAAHLGADQWSWIRLREEYRDQVRAVMKHHRKAWRELLARDVVTLVCRCSEPGRCHRRWLAQLLVAAGATDGGERQLSDRPTSAEIPLSGRALVE